MIETTEILNNPLALQNAILTEYESRLGGEVAVVDANNTFAFLLESFSQIVSDAAVSVEDKLSGLYPIRANTTKDLFNHISDYEYVGFFSFPAPLKMSLTLHRDFLVKNAIAVPDTNYQLLVIPSDTIITIGRYRFGLYYPIHIKINSLIDTISASYDVSEINPLKSLSTTNLAVQANTYEGVDLISIEFDTFQFDKTVYTESLNEKLGFIKKYSYSDKFYALRVFDITTGKVELNYSLSDYVYDTGKPTINLKVYPETNEIRLMIPQIYFTTGKIGTKLRVEIYTTVGAIDVSLNNLQLSDVTANFAMNSADTDLTYTNILKKIPTVIIAPMASRVTGGSNSYTFEEMKEFTIYHNNAISVPITRLDLESFFSRNGFTYMAKIDNLTDRRYYAYRKIYINDQELSITNGGITVLYDEDIINSGVLYQNNNTIVILPTVIYKYLYTVSKFEILDDVSANLIKNSAGSQLASMLNNGNYFCNPHHVVITTLDRYPACEFYDMFTTEAKNVTFIEENNYLSAQLSLVAVAIKHLGNGAGGYKIRISVQRSEDISTTDSSDLNCYLTVMSKEGFRIGIRGDYVGVYSDLDVFDFTINTNYKIKGTRLSVTNLKTVDATYAAEYEIELSGTMHIATFVRKASFPDVNQDDVIINYLTDNDNTWLGVSLQSFDYKLGANLSDILDPNLLTNWTSLQYQLYDINVPLTYEHDVYETNADGTLAYIIDPDSGEVTVNKIHQIGDVVYNNGDIVYKHHIGDVIIDAGGNPITSTSRIKDFTFELSAYEYSHNVVNTDFMQAVSLDLSAYYNTIRTMNESVLENTDIFFRPIITASTGRYKINNSSTLETDLELSFEFNCYVAQAVLDDAVMITAIESRIVTIVKNNVSNTIISLTDIAALIKSDLSTYINSIDVISLNGDTGIQTLMNIDTDKSPKLGTTLVVGRDNRLAYSPNVKINFKALDI